MKQIKNLIFFVQQIETIEQTRSAHKFAINREVMVGNIQQTPEQVACVQRQIFALITNT